MKAVRAAIGSMIEATEAELNGFLAKAERKTFARKALLSQPGKVANEVFFIEQGIVRVTITDLNGVEHTTHFALENQFIADYRSFLLQQKAVYALQALEQTRAIILPRSAIDWGYEHLKEGEKLGRTIAEYYFNYLDTRIEYLYTKSPKERYDQIGEIFPNIHNRVPQHMIASYLGITPVHLSRLKKQGQSASE
ncbi:MAG: Crp/Fnr family transcriptional regulator [Saprospiraceae bacterium]|nr:Crp/Fnr family transcriptional regulator [Saprospiraceae bacterium]